MNTLSDPDFQRAVFGALAVIFAGLAVVGLAVALWCWSAEQVRLRRIARRYLRLFSTPQGAEIALADMERRASAGLYLWRDYK